VSSPGPPRVPLIPISPYKISQISLSCWLNSRIDQSGIDYK
jgi:hypothetical protein